MSCLPRTRLCTALLGLCFLSNVIEAAVFTVVNTNPSGPGSLAQAAEDARTNQVEPDRIVFAIPGSGVHKITLSQGLDLLLFVTIDGYTQPGASPNTLSVGDNAVILIQLDGSEYGGGLSLGTGCIVRGLSLTGFSSASGGGYAILLGNFIDGDNNNTIEGNFIGLSPDGVTLNGNDYGIRFNGFGNENLIGGTTPAARNIISGNRIGITNELVNGTIVGNYLGTDATGLREGYGNGTAIVTGRNIIGTSAPGGGNVITGNTIGIEVIGFVSTIEGNLIGPRADGGSFVGNGTGIKAQGKFGSATIGGLAVGQGNVIAFNGTGVEVDTGSTILSNIFYGNSFMDIDLAGDGPTANDIGDRDAGANGLQNSPVIVSVTRDSGSTTVRGALNSMASAAFTLQFFANRAGPTPGQTFLGTQAVTTNSSGDVSFQFVFPVVTAASDFITATATADATATQIGGRTSEFFPANGAVELANISTRGDVGVGDNILIGGIILNSSASERTFLIRALGPSLNISGALADPKIELRASDGTLVGSNDNWRDSQEEQIIATGAAPTNNQEAAIVLPLPGESYTMQVSGVNGSTGIATVEIYALESATEGAKQFRNLSTRGNVGNGDNVLIGGTIIQGSAPQRLLFRAIGPDLAGAGVPSPLPDPTLELHNAEGTLLASNDDWRSDQEQEIIASGLAPQDDRNSVILTTLTPTSYTAITRGKNGAAGIALIETYKID